MLLPFVPHDTHLIRWLLWVRSVIAFGVLRGLFCAAATVLRRRWGALGLGAVLMAVVGWIISLAWSKYSEASGGLDRSHS